MLIVGLTGGIGSGKTTAIRFFQALGVPTVNTDIIARELVKPGTATLEAIEQHFGIGILRADGYLDRAALRQIIFPHPEKRQWLESLLHPLIRAELGEFIKRTKANQHPYCLLEIPLLFETRNTLSLLHRILVIYANVNLRRERVLQRDNLDATNFANILSAQVDDATRIQNADDLIENIGSIAELEEKIKVIHAFYLDLATHSIYS